MAYRICGYLQSGGENFLTLPSFLITIDDNLRYILDVTFMIEALIIIHKQKER